MHNPGPITVAQGCGSLLHHILEEKEDSQSSGAEEGWTVQHYWEKKSDRNMKGGGMMTMADQREESEMTFKFQDWDLNSPFARKIL